MSGLRDIVFLVVLVGLVPLSFMRPWWGVLGWSWIAYMAPHGLTWGFGRDLPVAMLIGGATLLGFLITKDRKPLPRVWAVYLLVLFVIHITLTSILAVDRELAFGKWDWVTKSILMTFVTMCLFQDRDRLRYLYMVMALGLGFWGLKGGLWVLRTGGGERVFGPDRSFFSDNNTLGLALCLVLPLLLYLSREEQRPWLKTIFRIVFAGSVIAIIFTYSRGAFLGLGVILAVLVWRSPWRLRFAAGLVVVALLSAPFLPDRLWNRIESITEQEDVETRDRSVAGRFEAWETGWRMALDRPFTGAGFRGYWNENLWEQYHPGDFIAARDAHSIYFEVLGEHGFVGLFLYLGILVNVLFHLRRIRKRWRKHPEHGYLSHYAEMLQLSFCPFLVSGAFLGVAYFDLYFHLISTGIILQVLSARAEKTVAPAAGRFGRPLRPQLPAPDGRLALPPAGTPSPRTRSRHA